MEQITKIVQATEEEISEVFSSIGGVSFEENFTELVEADFEMDESTFCPTPDSEGEIDEHAVAPTCESTGIFGSMYLGVNKSDSNINVRSGASTSHSIVGKIWISECFAFTGSSKSDGSYTWYQIEFLNPSNVWTVGWYRGYSGMAYWKNNPYSTVTSNDKLGGNYTCKTYRTNQTVKVWNGDVNAHFTVAPGHLLLCKDGVHGKTGSKYHTYLMIHGIRYNPGGGITQKDELITHLDGGAFGSTGYAVTNINKTPTNPTMRGNW